MPIFTKKSEDVLDLTDLRRRGLFKIDEVKKESVPVNSQGYVDYSQSSGGYQKPWEKTADSVQGPSQDAINQLVNSQSSSGSSQDDSGTSALGFLDTFASSAASSSSSDSSGGNNLEIQGLKNKIEDLEYKLRVLEDKIAGLGG